MTSPPNADGVRLSKVLVLLSILLLVCGAIAKFTSRLLVRPLSLLQEGIMEARARAAEADPGERDRRRKWEELARELQPDD